MTSCWTKPLPSDAQLITILPEWRVLDFISDLHLQAGEPENFAAWQAYMQQTRADAVFILGDLFEVWVGDDAANALQPGESSFESECAAVLRQAGARLKVYFMHGNRDFLLGEAFCDSTGMRLLDDPCVLQLPQERWVLSHGDALCLGDIDYQQFRATVRTSEWQTTFLAKPLRERRDIARKLREQSQAHKRASADFVDVDAPATVSLLKRSGARQMIHGHTHQPADHALAGKLHRHVLSDWDMGASPARAQVLRMLATAQGTASISRISPTQA